MTMSFYAAECRYKGGVDVSNHIIIEEVERRLVRSWEEARPQGTSSDFASDSVLAKALEYVSLEEIFGESHQFYHYHVKPNTKADTLKQADEGNESYFRVTDLPNAELETSWRRLHFESIVKDDLLSYCTTMMLATSRGMDLNVFDLHKIVLLHGPPGCGKTSLCKALAQKLAIRSNQLLQSETSVKMIQVNCHSLFSKWFSESGKQIMIMFDDIRSLASAPGAFVCLLIDEVESLTISRSSLFKGSEPSDSIRAINVLLTQIDEVKRMDNVLLLATSNLLETVDPAFLDRVDVQIELGPPGIQGVYEIIGSGIRELMTKGFVEDEVIVSFGVLTDQESLSGRLYHLSNDLQGASGRSLRKLPFLALTKMCGPRCIAASVYMDSLTVLAKQKV